MNDRKPPIGRNTILACARVLSSAEGAAAGGSGTIIFSAPNSRGGYSTYVLTNEHVVDNNITIEKRWHPVLKRNVEKEILGTVEVHFFNYRWEQRAVGMSAVDADIAAWDKEEDLALLKLRSDAVAPAAARLYPKDKESGLKIGEHTLAIGAALGEAPVLTVGRLSQFGREIENREFWLQTAPTIFGNSGGAVFLEDTEEFIGVPARIPVLLMGFGADAITHLSYMIPITRVYKFLDDQMFRFIYDTSFTEDGEAKAREEKRREEEFRLAAQKQLGKDEPAAK